MNASEKVKLAGMESLQQMADMIGEHHQMLSWWSAHKPVVFDILLDWCVKQLQDAANRHVVYAKDNYGRIQRGTVIGVYSNARSVKKPNDHFGVLVTTKKYKKGEIINVSV